MNRNLSVSLGLWNSVFFANTVFFKSMLLSNFIGKTSTVMRKRIDINLNDSNLLSINKNINFNPTLYEGREVMFNTLNGDNFFLRKLLITGSVFSFFTFKVMKLLRLNTMYSLLSNGFWFSNLSIFLRLLKHRTSLGLYTSYSRFLFTIYFSKYSAYSIDKNIMFKDLVEFCGGSTYKLNTFLNKNYSLSIRSKFFNKTFRLVESPYVSLMDSVKLAGLEFGFRIDSILSGTLLPNPFSLSS